MSRTVVLAWATAVALPVRPVVAAPLAAPSVFAVASPVAARVRSPAAAAAGAAAGVVGSGAESRVSAGAGAPIWTPGRLDAKAGLPGRWQRQLAERRAALRASPRNRGRAVTALLGLLGELHGDVADEDLVQLVEGVAGAQNRHALVRSYAAYLRGRLHEFAGEPRAARHVFAAQGYLLDWELVGPFENTGRAGHDAVYSPETEAFDPSQRFVGMLANEALEWRRYPAEASARAYVSFDAYLRPNTHAVGYATTWVHVPKSSRATVHVGSGGPHKVWVNGVLAGEGGAYRRVHPLQDAYVVRLQAGYNRVLIKVAVEDGAWGFFARISTPGGAAISGLSASAGAQAPAAQPLVQKERPAKLHRKRSRGGETEPGVRALSMRALLEASAARSGARGADKLALVDFYRRTTPFGEDDRSALKAAQAADAAIGTSRSAWLLTRIDPDPNDSHTALIGGIDRARKEGRKARSRLGTMLLELGWRSGNLGLETRARDLFAQAHAASPDDALIELARVDQLAQDGFPVTALDWLEDLIRRYPKSATLRREKASRLVELGRVREGLQLLELLSGEQQADATLLSQRIGVHMQLGEVDEAVVLASRIVAGTPGRPSGHVDLAHLLEAQGRPDAAIAALVDALSLAPQDPELHAAMGHVLARSGYATASLGSFRRSLELKPQQPHLRDILAVFDAAGEEGLESRYVRDLEEILEEEGDVPASWAGKDVGIVHQLFATRVHANGLSERVEHRVIRILDDRGTRSQAVQSFTYDPQESYVQVRRARVRRKDGRVEKMGTPRVVSLAASGYRMYYDQRQVRVHFPGLRVGDVLEVVFVRRDVAARNKFDEYFGELIGLSGVEPRKRVEYVLEAPAGRKLYFSQDMEQRSLDGGRTVVYRFAAHDIAGIKPEANMPGWSEVAQFLHVSTYKDWGAVGRWYWGLVKDQLIVDDKIRAAVRQSVAGLGAEATTGQKVAALYRHVVRNTRYVGLEFGIHGYKPYKTTEVYDRRFGDCKDKASLLKVMLKEIGIESHLVLVRTRDLGVLQSDVASLAAFNHAIVYVPELELFLDGTAEYSGPSELPIGDQGASVLVVEDGRGATFRRIPVSSAAANTYSTAQRVKLDVGGNAEVVHEFELSGASAARWRQGFQAEGDREENFTKLMGGRFPGVEVVSARFPGITDILQPVRVQAKFQVPAWAQTQAEGLRFEVNGRPSNLVGKLAPQVKREHVLVLEAPTRRESSIEYAVPPSMRFSQVPGDIHITTRFGRFDLNVTSEGQRATVESILEITAQRVDPGEYREFRAFLHRVDASLEQAFELERRQ
ncbi:MAG: DUF3857 domain-containing protein [Nannocystaceae bacterium]